LTQAQSNKKSPEDVKRELSKLTVDFASCFGTPQGKKVLEHLTEQFEARSSVVPGDSYATHMKEGERYVVLYIKDLITIGAKQ